MQQNMKAPSLVLSDTMTTGKWHILYKLETKIVLTIKISTGYFIFSETFIVVSLKQIKNNRKRQSAHAEGSLLLLGKYDM